MLLVIRRLDVVGMLCFLSPLSSVLGMDVGTGWYLREPSFLVIKYNLGRDSPKSCFGVLQFGVSGAMSWRFFVWAPWFEWDLVDLCPVLQVIQLKSLVVLLSSMSVWAFALSRYIGFICTVPSSKFFSEEFCQAVDDEDRYSSRTAGSGGASDSDIMLHFGDKDSMRQQ